MNSYPVLFKLILIFFNMLEPTRIFLQQNLIHKIISTKKHKHGSSEVYVL